MATECKKVVDGLVKTRKQGKQEAKELAEGLASQICQLLSRKQDLVVTSSLFSVGPALQIVHQQSIDVEHSIKEMEISLGQLCAKFSLPMPRLKAAPLISKEAL